MSFFSLFPTVTSSCFSISFFFLFYFFFFFLSFFLSFFISFFLSLPFRRDYDEFPTLRQNVFVSPLHPFARLWEHLRRRGRGHVRLFPPKVRNGEKQLHHEAEQNSIALWSGINKNQDVSTGPLARPFARSLAPLTRLLAPDCSLRSRPPLRTLVCSLAHFAHSLACGKMNFRCLKMTWFCAIVEWGKGGKKRLSRGSGKSRGEVS